MATTSGTATFGRVIRTKHVYVLTSIVLLVIGWVLGHTYLFTESRFIDYILLLMVLIPIVTAIQAVYYRSMMMSGLISLAAPFGFTLTGLPIGTITAIQVTPYVVAFAAGLLVGTTGHVVGRMYAGWSDSHASANQENHGWYVLILTCIGLVFVWLRFGDSLFIGL